MLSLLAEWELPPTVEESVVELTSKILGLPRGAIKKELKTAKVDLAQASVEIGANRPKAKAGAKPQVYYSYDEGQMHSQILEHLGQLGWESESRLAYTDPERVRIYQRNRQLVQVAYDLEFEGLGDLRAPKETPLIGVIPRAIIRERITQACEIVSVDAKGEKTKMAPQGKTVEAIHDRSQYPQAIKPLTGIITCPTLRPDGGILQTPGYDDRTGLIYDPSSDFDPIPKDPTKEDAEAAIETLLDLIAEFPFADAAHKSSWVALVLTLVNREAITGPCPLFLADASGGSAGKSLLMDAASTIATGSDAARDSYTTQEEEMRKKISAIVLAGFRSVLFDNLSSGGRIGGATFDRALTSRRWQDRLLGSNKMLELPITTVWMATGNNLSTVGEIVRRTIYLRLESNESRPELRSNFKYPDLLGHIRANRSKYVAAAITILRAWHVAKKPRQKISGMASFSEWSDLIRHALVWLGQPDPIDSQRILRESDTTNDEVSLIHAMMRCVDPRGTGITAAGIAELANSGSRATALQPLREFVSSLKSPTSNAIGYKLRRHKGSVIAGSDGRDL